jgi:hypothetical protein
MAEGSDFADVMLGLPGFRVTAVTLDEDELLVGIETIRQGGRLSLLWGDRAHHGPPPRDHPRPVDRGSASEARLVQTRLCRQRCRRTAWSVMEPTHSRAMIPQLRSPSL